MRIDVDFTQTAGPVKPLHGFCNGPLSGGGTTDLTEQFREAGVPYVRYHDVDWPNGRVVDLPQIFPDLKADPEDPASYHFELTDDLLERLAATGAQAVYRLGVSIDHARHKQHTQPPADFDAWSAACVGIIRHYNEGWANGYRYHIPYWEIWNEPDLADTPDTPSPMWTGGTPEQYYRLYEIASKRIKACCPAVKVGGYAAASVWNEPFVRGFLAHCRDRACPLDFFSWHTYAPTPEDVAACECKARAYLEEYGFGSVETICDEWNYMHANLWLPLRENTPVGVETRHLIYDRQRSMFGAAFDAAVLIALQHTTLGIATYYETQLTSNWNGLFTPYGEKRKPFYAFGAFNALYCLGTEVPVVLSDAAPGVYALAATDGREQAVLLVNFEGEDTVLTLGMTGLPASADVELYRLDDASDLSFQRSDTVFRQAKQRFPLVRNSVILLKIQSNE